jgi:hypothetical protein
LKTNVKKSKSPKLLPNQAELLKVLAKIRLRMLKKNNVSARGKWWQKSRLNGDDTKNCRTSASPARRMFELKPIMRPKAGLHHTISQGAKRVSVRKQLLGV